MSCSPQKALYLITLGICGCRRICKKRRLRYLCEVSYHHDVTLGQTITTIQHRK